MNNSPNMTQAELAIRKKIIAAIHVKAKQIFPDDDCYRVFLRHSTGKTSCKDMNRAELEQIENLLYHRLERPGITDMTAGQVAKLQQLCEELGWEYGIHDRRLTNFAERTLKIQILKEIAQLNKAQATTLITGVQRWVDQIKRRESQVV